MSHLIACTGCARHVRATDPLCPFCGEALPMSLRSQAPRLPAERLGRAATFVFGATLAASSAVGCGDSHTPGSDGGGGDRDAGIDSGAVAPPYGIPPDDSGVEVDAGSDAGAGDDAGVGMDAGFDAGAIAPPYGLPPEDAGGGVPLYGGAPDPDEPEE